MENIPNSIAIETKARSGKFKTFSEIMHKNLRFEAILNEKDPSKAKLNVNYEDAAMCCMLEHMYQMKDFYEDLISNLENSGAPPITIGIVNQVANQYKILEFIHEVS